MNPIKETKELASCLERLIELEALHCAPASNRTPGKPGIKLSRGVKLFSFIANLEFSEIQEVTPVVKRLRLLAQSSDDSIRLNAEEALRELYEIERLQPLVDHQYTLLLLNDGVRQLNARPGSRIKTLCFSFWEWVTTFKGRLLPVCHETTASSLKLLEEPCKHLNESPKPVSSSAENSLDRICRKVDQMEEFSVELDELRGSGLEQAFAAFDQACEVEQELDRLMAAM